MPGRNNDELPLKIEELRPPTWLLEAHTSADLGYIGYYPPRPDQEEDILTEVAVKNGLALPASVAAETWSAQAIVKDNLAYENAVSDLEELMNQIFARRAEAIPAISPSSFKIPSRVTLNDARRTQWFRELADSKVPLQKLGKSVPHGAKGHDLLDLLYTHEVETSRALWFLRVFGANETAGQRTKPGYDPTGYSVEWAHLVTGYMKKQLGEINLPSAPRPGLNIKQIFKGVLSDPESRERWISRFVYILNLMRSFYSEGLVDNRTFLSWLVLQLGTCNLAQAGFMARLADEYLDGILICRALARPFIDACLTKLNEIYASPTREYLPKLELMLKTFVQRACLVLPDAFISPRMWITHKLLLDEIFSSQDAQDQEIPDPSTSYLRNTLSGHFDDFKTRNEAMLFRDLPKRVLARLSEAVTDVLLLNSISISTDLDTFSFFGPQLSDAVFASKVDRLLTWSVTPLQYGDHRPYAAVTLLRRWLDRAGERATRRDFISPHETLQDLLFHWLDASEVAGEETNLMAVAVLFGELVKCELFEYAIYVQRLIARCEQGLSYAAECGSRHRNFLRWIPLHKSTSSIVTQRKITLHGVRARETPEEQTEKEIRGEIRLLLPDLFSENTDLQTLMGLPVPHLTSFATLLSAPRYEQVRVVRQWLLPILLRTLPSRLADPLTEIQAIRSYCITVELMAQVKCYGSIMDLGITLLESTTSQGLLTVLIETFRRYLAIWASMNVLKRIGEALAVTHNLFKSRGIVSRRLLMLMMDIDHNRILDPTVRKSVEAEFATFAQALHPPDEHPRVVPTHLQEILLLPNDTRPDAAATLANSLWFTYRTASDWGWRVWDNTFASLRLKPTVPFDTATARARSFCYANFLLYVDQHLPNGLDEHVFNWFNGPGISELIAVDAEAWDCITVTLLYLAVNGAMSTATILKGLVYPLWQLALKPPVPGTLQAKSQPSEVYLRAAHDIFARLLLHTDGTSDGIPPTDFIECQRIRTRRADVFQEPHLSLLVSNIPVLVFLEKSEHIPEDLRMTSGDIRSQVCAVTEFRQGIYRNLDMARDAFETLVQYDTLEESLLEPLMDALRLILNVARTNTAAIGSSEWLDTSSLLSPWKLAATAIEVQFTLKQMGERLALGTPHTHGKTKVDRLIAQFLHHHMSTEEADFVADMARGVGPTIVSKFVNMGLWCIAETLKNASAPLSTETVQEVIDVASEQLRLLAHVVEPVRDDPLKIPSMDFQTQDEFFAALTNKMEALDALVSSSVKGTCDMAPQLITHGAVLMARLLQFNLGFKGVWTPKTRDMSSRMCVSVFRLALAHGAGDFLDQVAFPLFLDTFCYLLDEIANDTKSNNSDLFRNYPKIAIMDLPPDMPAEYRQQLRALLPFLPPNEVVADIAFATRDAAGNIITGSAVQNRPWEWTEYLGGQPADENEDHHRSDAIRNSASLSLDLFNARPTGEPIVPYVPTTGDSKVEASIRSFQDDMYSDSLFARDWRETRMSNLHDSTGSGGNRSGRGEGDDELGPLPTFHGSSRRGSPSASSGRSRSAHPSGTSSRLQSPSFQTLAALNGGSTSTTASDTESHAQSHGGGTASSATIGSGKGKRAGKRKAEAAADSDIEFVDDAGPVAPPPKKGKGKAPPKTKAKKR